MKTLFRGAVAAVALVSMSGVAHAQTNERHYAGIIPIVNIPYTSTNPSGLALLGLEVGLLAGVGTRYTAEADAPSNTTTATPTVTVAFNLSGTVTKDCSFYAGNNANATNIDFGVIGVRTGNNENVNDAFDMVGPAEAEIESLTAGCNFNNTVSLAKTNGIQGMVNTAPGGYDTNEFQANIPYEVDAAWTGVAQNAVTTGSPQSLSVATNQGSNSIGQGAWRSAMQIDINAPVAPLALVAGTYQDTLTLTLSAI
ncbi:hypothetical protein GCM10011371_33270 [Novosphingobium marinum]|uniref:Spore coat protein U/FanG domain-containing protein n=1 Tax=Novosphingobium marinum TaxID=1514948 RepID=A0A7Y9Y1T3_9SPHN|nr:spore coat protein U domain-containing protein [Novosphingobium marinum]NYH97051.1 hypothetical protein [Novosphingobium marinum]GGC43162.1 hypothetical protein GCM10011371_33270 [Novosphingobium marinum]